jgi:hypothetical protein
MICSQYSDMFTDLSLSAKLPGATGDPAVALDTSTAFAANRPTGIRRSLQPIARERTMRQSVDLCVPVARDSCGIVPRCDVLMKIYYDPHRNIPTLIMF